MRNWLNGRELTQDDQEALALFPQAISIESLDGLVKIAGKIPKQPRKKEELHQARQVLALKGIDDISKVDERSKAAKSQSKSGRA